MADESHGIFDGRDQESLRQRMLDNGDGTYSHAVSFPFSICAGQHALLSAGASGFPFACTTCP